MAVLTGEKFVLQFYLTYLGTDTKMHIMNDYYDYLKVKSSLIEPSLQKMWGEMDLTYLQNPKSLNFLSDIECQK